MGYFHVIKTGFQCDECGEVLGEAFEILDYQQVKSILQKRGWEIKSRKSFKCPNCLKYEAEKKKNDNRSTPSGGTRGNPIPA